MARKQGSTSKRQALHGPFDLRTDRLGPLPLVNHFIDRLGLESILDRFVPSDGRSIVTNARSLGVLLRSIIVEREPIYRQQETVAAFAPGAFGISRQEVAHVGDDRVGRALARLFDADRGALLTEVVVRMAKEFSVRFDQLHNDSTTVRFSGQYKKARGRSIRGRRGPWICFGRSKDHRPDLKQLLFILTTSADGGVPVQFRAEAGNTDDSQTHIYTWAALREVAGKSSFLYVADSKLCTRENMDYIDGNGGRFVTVLPRTRIEDSEFRHWLESNEPDWELASDRPNPRRKYGPRDRWWVFRYPVPSQEGWPVTWVWSSLLALRQEQTRRERISRALQDLEDLKRRLANPRSRLRKHSEIERLIEEIVRAQRVEGYVRAERVNVEDHTYHQTHRGRPGPETQYRRRTRQRSDVQWEIDEQAIEYDRRSDGMYPLLSNDRSLTPSRVLEAHKGQPTIEKRFEQTKTVHEIAPVFLKNEDRVEALFFLYFLALLVQGLIEREVRRAMRRERIKELPLYPEERQCRHPTTEQILRLFSHVDRHVLTRRDGDVVQVFQPQLTELQREVLRLLAVPLRAYRESH